MYMFKYVLKRLGLMLLTFFIIFTMCFVLIKLLPIPTNALPGQDPEIVMRTLEGRGWITNIQEGENGVWTYDRVPILIQYGNYIKRIVTKGDFGIATTYGEYLNMNLWDVFVSHMPPTILINIYSTLIGVPIGLGLGILAALKKNKWQDQVINIFIILLISVPSIVLALMIQYVFCFKLGWFPLTMSTSNEYFTWEVFRSMLPAVFALCLGSIAGYARYTRAELSEVLTDMTFTSREQTNGNRVEVTANRLQYASLTQRIEMARELGDRGMIMRDEIRELFNLAPLPDGLGQTAPVRGEYYNVGESKPAKEGEENEQAGT